MKLQDLEHLLRASGDILGEKQFIVIGSQSLLGKFPNAPAEMMFSREADFIPKTKKRDLDKLNVIGEGSDFEDTHGYYVDPVDETTAILPRGWKGRLINVNSPNTNGVTGLCLDPHDLFIAKVAAGREKDFEFVRSMITNRMVDKDRVLELAETVVNPEDDLERSSRIMRKITGLYANVAVEYTKQVNSYNGRYTGLIIGVSDSVVQQSIGRGDFVFHDLSNLDKKPTLHQDCTIQYRDGRASVHIAQQEKGLAR
ncbi:MAG TPA: DUF6036 family nucleotidyltransferase [Noviherbaspirillum sp.]|nr:DUF6036 family nucleotidyltransferase [Noviherbaspirillum sp.]